jgi:hypothetical protein
MREPPFSIFTAARQLAEAMNMVGRCFDQGWGARPAEEAPDGSNAAEADLDWHLYFATMLAWRGSDGSGTGARLVRRAARGRAKSANMVGSFHEDGWSVPVNRALVHHYARAAEAAFSRGLQPCPDAGRRRQGGQGAALARPRARSCPIVRERSFLGQMAAGWLDAKRPNSALFC